MWHIYSCVLVKPQSKEERKELDYLINLYGFKYIKDLAIPDKDSKYDYYNIVLFKTLLHLDREEQWRINLIFFNHFENKNLYPFGVSRSEYLDSFYNLTVEKEEEEVCI